MEMILLAIILLIVGLVMTIKPDIWWQLTESWKSYSAGDPSDFYIKVIRIGGIVFLVMALMVFVLLFFI